jgi:hypothetical protein
MSDSQPHNTAAGIDPLLLESLDWNALRRLWPNRTHESNWIKDVICRLGLHRWYPVEVPGPDCVISCLYCRWCPEIKVRQISPANRTESY